jgi:hypothetical protein
MTDSSKASRIKPEPQETGKYLSEDLKTFEKLPVKTRELLLLGDEAEKATGKVRADVDRQIQPQPGLPKH